MSEMIEEIKLERADVKAIVEELEKETAEAKKIADGAFKREKCYVANSFEDAYNTDGQKELRDLIQYMDSGTAGQTAVQSTLVAFGSYS